MSDCANVEMRELLPELAAGTLDASTRSRVEAHVASCADCASELETLRAVRAAYSGAPVVDVGRVVAALPKPATARRGALRAPMKRWLDWRIAAALTTITVGGLSLAVMDRLGGREPVAAQPPVAAAVPDSPAVSPAQPASVPGPRVDTSVDLSSPKPPTPASRRPQLAFGGGVDDLDDVSLRALLGALDEIERAPVAPSAEPDRTPVLPVIKEGQR